MLDDISISGAGQRVTYLSNRKLFLFLRGSIILLLILDIAQIIYLVYDVMNGLHTSPDITSTFEKHVPWISYFFSVSYLAVIVLYCVWIYRSSVNSRRLPGLGSPQFTPGLCVGYHFVPVVHLWMPFQAVKEILDRFTLSATGESQKTGIAFYSWWAFFGFSHVIMYVLALGSSYFTLQSRPFVYRNQLRHHFRS